MFQTFTLNGDLDAGLRLWSIFENNQAANEKSDANADDAWYYAQKIEKNLIKIAKNAGATSDS